jgi:hypothetical protein
MMKCNQAKFEHSYRSLIPMLAIPCPTPRSISIIYVYLPDFEGLSSENSACHNDSHACFFAGDFTGEAFAGD